ncbi:MAG: hypothetical protein AB1753_03320 [Thermoproteota archaeon]
MSAEERLVKRILSAGSAGVKKADLRKETSSNDVDAIIEALVSRGIVFVDKRGSAYYCFHKDHYLQSLLNSDPRFRITYDLIKSLEESVASSSKEVSKAIETLAGNISNLARLVTESGGNSATAAAVLQASAAPRRAPMQVADFKREFDSALASNASSIGWVELARVRSEVCTRCGLASDEFYRLVGELTGQYQDKYELSTGGGEGVMVRGLLHGFVRCI